MSGAQQRRAWRRQAAAIKNLEPCNYQYGCNSQSSSSRLSAPKLHQLQQQPVWDFQPVQLPASSRMQMRTSNENRTGQAILSLPFKHVDVALQLPPSLQLAATPSGNIDCRMQLFGITAEWPAYPQPHAGDADSMHAAKLLPAKSAAAGFAVRSGAVLLAHALFPDHTHNLLGWLAVPVAVADGIALAHSALPEAARHTAATGARKLKDRLQGGPKKYLSSSGPVYQQYEQGVGWLDAAGGVMLGALHTLRCLSGPAAAVASAGWLWNLLHPSSHSLCSCMVALLAVAADYSQLSNAISRGRLGTGREVEAAWHARHKKAAQRLAQYCRDLPVTPPLQPLLHAASCCSIAAGLAVDGQGLSGLVPAPHSIHSTATSSGGTGAQLLLSASIHMPADGSSSSKTQRHAAAGLSRKQLLELFTGSTDDPLAASVGASCGQATHVVQPAAPATTVVFEAGEAVHSSGSRCCQAGDGSGLSRCSSAVCTACCSSSTGHPAHLTVQLRNDHDCEKLEAIINNVAASCGTAATMAAAGCSQTASRQQQLVCSQGASCRRSTAAAVGCSRDSADAVATADPLAFLDALPLYGQEDHAGGSNVLLAGKHSGMWQSVELGLRAVYLLVVFAPFLLLGVPMLLVSWWLLSRAAAAQQQQHHSNGSDSSSSSRQNLQADDPLHDMAIMSPLLGDYRSSSALQWVTNLPHAVAQAATHPAASLWQLLQQFLTVLMYLAALLDLLLVLLLGGHWAAGISAWESAGLFLRKRAWQLLLFSSSAAGAAFIKWGQWSASRRDIFPEDFCDTLAALHDRAPVHSFRHSRRQIEAAFGKKLDELFITFDPKPLASGSIAQVHRATLRNSSTGAAATAGAAEMRSSHQTPHSSTTQQQQYAGSASQEVVVKVCHPNVYRHICMDFRLLSGLSAAAARIPALRGLSLRESVAQFSHTMTAQTDLRVEAVHALRFHTNFSGVRSSVQIPRPIPGLVSEQVLVESFEAGRSVAVFMKEPTPINPQIVALGVDAFLKMLLVDNFVHTDLHPGNILFRAVPVQQQRRRRSAAPKQQAGQLAGSNSSRSSRKRWWQFWRRAPHISSRRSADASNGAAAAAEPPAQWELELQGMIDKQQNLWASRQAAGAAAAANDTSSNESRWLVHAAAGTAADDQAATQLEQQLGGSSSGSGSSGSSTAAQEPALAAQLVLLDFGLAEQLNAEVRHHFISFLNAISAGDGLCAARHLLRWSHHQTCTDTVAFKADVVDLFNSSCNIHSEAGIDLDAVMKAVLGLARKHGVSIDSCYASLVISVCVLVGFATSLDPGVNIMDAATPGLLAYSLTGKVLGRLYS